MPARCPLASHRKKVLLALTFLAIARATLYDELEISQTATPKEIRDAYRRCAHVLSLVPQKSADNQLCTRRVSQARSQISPR